MKDQDRPPTHQRWAHFRFSVVGHLLASPPPTGELALALRQLAARSWAHPVTGEPYRFSVTTVERWYYEAKAAAVDPVGALRRRVRKDQGLHPSLSPELKEELRLLRVAHRRWSYQLVFDNLDVVARQKELGRVPSYTTVRRYMRGHGLRPHRRRPDRSRGLSTAAPGPREVRSWEVAQVHALWHLDFHEGSRRVLTQSGEWVRPVLLGVIDDRSRLICHTQWYLAETAQNLVHGLSQAFQKRGLPRALMSDNGAAMIAAETQQGLGRLGILAELITPGCPYQNGKMEAFWGPVEGRLLAMLEGQPEITLAELNLATQAWIEGEYHHRPHKETGEPPLERFRAGPDAGRPCPETEILRQAFGVQETRAQRASDGSITLQGRRFEIPVLYAHLDRVCARYARWDLAYVYLVDPRTDKVLCRLYPQDKLQNADGVRRRVPEGDPPAAGDLARTTPGMAPLLSDLVARYCQTGLPPAFIPSEAGAPKNAQTHPTPEKMP